MAYNVILLSLRKKNAYVVRDISGYLGNYLILQLKEILQKRITI